MDHYIDINILPDPDPDSDFSNSFLLRALFNKFHKALVELSDNGIGISFPHYPNEAKDYKKGVGNLLRVHGSQSSLNALMETNWLHRMGDYLAPVSVRPVPENHTWVTVRRKQDKYANIAKLRRTYIRRHNVSQAEAELAYPDTLIKRKLKLPYITIKSSSTKQHQFPLFIEQLVEQVKTDENVNESNFNAYGLSKTAVLPFF